MALTKLPAALLRDTYATPDDVDAVADDLTAHEADTSAHGVAGAVVGTSDSQTLTSKTLVVANNTVTTAASGNLAATELNAALAELQTDIDTRTTASSTTTFTNKTFDADGTGNSITNIENADIKAAAGIELSKLAAVTASRVLGSDGSGFVAALDTATYPSLTELSYVKGVTSSIQTQINGIAAAPDIELYLDTGNGHGSTNTVIRRFTNSRKNTLGAYATYADSSTDGASVTITSTGAGLWSIAYTDQSSTAQTHGISINSANLTTSIVSLTYAQGKRGEESCGAGGSAQVAILQRLVNGDVVRPHTNGSNDGTGNRVIFHMVRISN